MVLMAMVAMVAMTGCGGDGNDVADVNVGDDTANEIIDTVTETIDNADDGLFADLWDAGQLGDTIDHCFAECDETYPDVNGGKTDDNLQCVAECKK